MGTKSWMLVYANGSVARALQGTPQLDREATGKLAGKLFPKDKLLPIGDGDLVYTCPPDDELHIGCFPGVSILAAIDLFVCAKWVDGELVARLTHSHFTHLNWERLRFLSFSATSWKALSKLKWLTRN